MKEKEAIEILRGLKFKLDKLFPYRCEGCGKPLTEDEPRGFQSMTLCRECCGEYEMGDLVLGKKWKPTT